MIRAALAILLLYAGPALATQAQPVPISEDPSVAPQINISGVGLGTLAFDRGGEAPGGKNSAAFTDSALQFGGAQKLLEGGGVGSFGMGWVTSDASGKGTGSPFFLHRAFVDYQDERLEILIGRSDGLNAHLVDFPTLRGDDLTTLTNPLNPFSSGKSVEEHRYANVVSTTFNQELKYFENFHAQHLINSADPNPDAGLNSYGVTFEYLGAPGLEAFERVPAWGLGYEWLAVKSKTSSAVQQASIGGVVNLNESVVNRLELSLQSSHSWGSEMTAFSSNTDTFEADSNGFAASLRYLRTPFGRPAYQVALTAAQKTYGKVSDANSSGFALTGVRRLGHGFDVVAQYQGQSRSPKLAAWQSHGEVYEQRAEIGFSFSFDATFNEHLSPRRRLLNQKHHYLSN